MRLQHNAEMEVHRIPSPSDRLYQEFVRSSDLSVGVYRLEPGSTDSQQPHNEDELYYVVAGRARFTSGDQTVEVAPGLCLFVPARESHRFHDIVERLELLVVFVPAEGSRETPP
jgi:mannose-6-phosphate isomerase-like protein (cupin superfamily)